MDWCGVRRLAEIVGCAALLLIGTGCKASEVAGEYRLEESAMKQVAREEVAGLPKEKAQFAQFQRAMLGRMGVILVLRSDGSAEMKMAMINPLIKGHVETQVDRGEWRFVGGRLKLALTPQGKTEAAISLCSWSKEKIVCASDDTGKKQPLIFSRVASPRP